MTKQPLRREIDLDVLRAEHAAFEAKCQALHGAGQRLLARIRPSSKHHGQSDESGVISFPMQITRLVAEG